MSRYIEPIENAHNYGTRTLVMRIAQFRLGFLWWLFCLKCLAKQLCIGPFRREDGIASTQLKHVAYCCRYPGILLICMALACGAAAETAPAPAPAAANSSVGTTEQAWAAVLAATMLASNNGAHPCTHKPEDETLLCA